MEIECTVGKSETQSQACSQCCSKTAFIFKVENSGVNSIHSLSRYEPNWFRDKNQIKRTGFGSCNSGPAADVCQSGGPSLSAFFFKQTDTPGFARVVSL